MVPYKYILVLAIFILGTSIYLTLGSNQNFISLSKQANKLSESKLDYANIDSDSTDTEDEKNSAIAVDSSPLLDPQDNQNFIISFTMKLFSLPGNDKRQKLLAKYDSSSLAPVGWSVAIRQIPSSVRLEVYLKNKEGNGGWYTLGPIETKLNTNYHYLIVIRLNSFIFAKMQELNEDNIPIKGQQIRSLGGLPIEEITSVTNNNRFRVTSGHPKFSQFNSDIENVLIFTSDKLIPPNEIDKNMAKGPNFLFDLNQYNCIFSQSERKSSCAIP